MTLGSLLSFGGLSQLKYLLNPVLHHRCQNVFFFIAEIFVFDSLTAGYLQQWHCCLSGSVTTDALAHVYMGHRTEIQANSLCILMHGVNRSDHKEWISYLNLEYDSTSFLCRPKNLSSSKILKRENVFSGENQGNLTALVCFHLASLSKRTV